MRRGTGWQATFYSACDVLTKSLGTDLAYLFGKPEADIAQALIKASRDQSAKAIKKTIAQFKNNWKKRKKPEQETLAEQALVWATRHEGHRVSCPACGSSALVTGSPAGVPVRSMAGDTITEKQYVLPAQLECVACRLKIAGLSHLSAAGLGGRFHRNGGVRGVRPLCGGARGRAGLQRIVAAALATGEAVQQAGRTLRDRRDTHYPLAR